MDRLQQIFKSSALSPNCCTLCYVGSDALDHIFVHCALTSDIWRSFHLASDIHMPMPNHANWLCEGAFSFKADSQREILI